jgi:hypothetical protein
VVIGVVVAGGSCRGLDSDIRLRDILLRRSTGEKGLCLEKDKC